uniref:protein NLP3-like n=1 Tax=Erigeron canadensis TaxID=72917 RepID=UPI001CB8ADAD|nr:protein NLP3-like [Erigeron canadensis]
MELCEQQSTVDIEDGEKSSELLWNKVSLVQPTVPTAGDARYLTRLWVSEIEEPLEQLHRREITYKIRSALKQLTFREKHVLIQFWSARSVGKHQLLTTVDQPFGLGIVVQELCLYRRESEHSAYLVDKDHEEQDNNPPARVFRRGLPEWTFDITNYNPKDFPQQDYLIRRNLYGYMALPVFDSTTGLCVGVLELLMSSKYMSYAFEVQQIHNALKTKNLATPEAFDSPVSTVRHGFYTQVLDERKQSELYVISSILQTVSDIHSLPLAQTWAMSPTGSFVSRENVIEKTCSSYDSRCIGKACMSTTALPFYVRDVGMWQFREACRVQHLHKSRGIVGRAMLAHASCYCQDVTALGEEEYPLVHNARMSRLASCLTVFLHSLVGNDDGYVLEFFLSDNKDSNHVLNLVQTLKQKVEAVSGLKLGETSTIEGIGKEGSNLSSSINPDTIHISSSTWANTSIFENSSNSESFLATTSYSNVSTMKKNDIFTDAGKNSFRLKQGRKSKINSLTMKSLEQQLGKPIGQAAKSLGVSRSTLKRFCRVHGISSWPTQTSSTKIGYLTNSYISQESWPEKHLQRSSSPSFALSVAVFVVLGVKRWSCSSKRHGFAGKWWSCGKHSYLPSRSYSIYQITRLVVGLMRWRRKSSKRHAMPYNPSLYLSIGNLKHETSLVNKYINVDQPLLDSGLICASSKQSVGTGLDMGLVLTVKASFNDDMIKFRFPITSGLLELENEVAQRVNVKGKKLSLKYKDEDNDLVSITCDADLYTLPELLATNSTIKLHVQVADD